MPKTRLQHPHSGSVCGKQGVETTKDLKQVNCPTCREIKGEAFP